MKVEGEGERKGKSGKTKKEAEEGIYAREREKKVRDEEEMIEKNNGEFDILQKGRTSKN